MSSAISESAYKSLKELVDVSKTLAQKLEKAVASLDGRGGTVEEMADRVRTACEDAWDLHSQVEDVYAAIDE